MKSQLLKLTVGNWEHLLQKNKEIQINFDLIF
jgi:hypothetical protein